MAIPPDPKYTTEMCTICGGTKRFKEKKTKCLWCKNLTFLDKWKPGDDAKKKDKAGDDAKKKNKAGNDAKKKRGSGTSSSQAKPKDTDVVLSENPMIEGKK